MEDFPHNGHIALIMIIGTKIHCASVKAVISSSQVVPVKRDPISLWNMYFVLRFVIAGVNINLVLQFGI